MDKLTISELDGEPKTIEAEGLVRVSFEINGEQKHHCVAIATLYRGLMALPRQKIYPRDNDMHDKNKGDSLQIDPETDQAFKISLRSGKNKK